MIWRGKKFDKLYCDIMNEGLDYATWDKFPLFSGHSFINNLKMLDKE